MNRVMITGGSGFVGSHLIDSLLRDGATEVHVFDVARLDQSPNLKHLMLTDPIPNVVIPTWAIVAYLVIAIKPRVGEKP